MTKWTVSDARGRQILFLADANATVHATIPDISVDILSRHEMPTSQPFLKGVMDMGLWNPALYSDYSSTCVSTSFPKTSKAVHAEGVRVDYVLLSSEVTVKEGSANTWSNFVMPHLHKDHHPVCLQIFPKLNAGKLSFVAELYSTIGITLRIPCAGSTFNGSCPKSIGLL